MDDSNNIKTNFLGKDGFRWWIGQVPPAPNHKVNWNVNKTGVSKEESGLWVIILMRKSYQM